MPGRNIVKIYAKNSHYHIYNRGVEKRKIFLDEMDYKVFLKYLRDYLSVPPDPKTLRKEFTLQGGTFKGVPRQIKNYSDEIKLIAFCLMPNHFHLLVKQKSKTAIKDFIRSLLTRYAIYFNKKYHRVGKLFQGHYKGVLINDDPYLLHLTRYIHLNPYKLSKNLLDSFSSYSTYLGIYKLDWVKTEFILKFFDQAQGDFLKGTNSYKDFVENYQKDSKLILGDLVLE